MSKLKGRPIRSQIRQNIVEILYVGGPLHGYEIFNIYLEIFEKVHIRSIYYNLKKGTSMGELKVERIVQEEGDFSWGNKAEKIYYSVGDQAKTIGDPKVIEFFNKKKQLLNLKII